MPFSGVRTSLAGRTLLQVGLGVTVIVVLSTAVTYWLIYREIEQRTLGRLWEYADQRAQFHQADFTLVKEYHEVVKAEVVRRYATQPPDASARFDRLMARYPDGALRNAAAYSDVSRISNAWVHRDANVDDRFKRLMMLYFDVSEQYARMVGRRFVNLYFIDPSGHGNMGWEDPAKVDGRRWIYETAADYDYPSLESVQNSLPQANPERKTTWSSPNFEPGYRKYIVAAATPIYAGDAFIGIIGTDVLVEDLQRSIVQSQIPGTKHSVFSADGRVIVDAEFMDASLNQQSGYWIRDSGDARLQSLLAAANQGRGQSSKGYDAAADHYYALGWLEGPNWYFASTMPGRLVRAEAFRSAQWVLWAGLASLAGLLSVLAIVLRRQVGRPLRSLIAATRRVSEGGHAELALHGAGEVGTLMGAFNDMGRQIGERDRALRAEKERFRALTEHGADFIVVMDAQGINRYVSPTIEKILGHAPEDVLGKCPFDLMHRDDRDAMREAFEQCAAVPFSRTGKLRYRTRDKQGAWRWMECSGTNLIDSEAVNGFVVNQHDITEQVAAEQELERQRDLIAQRERLASMGSLLAGVAHELNNPLSVVVGRAVMLEEETSDPGIQATAQRIRTAAERCTRIVRTFLAMARRSQQARSMVSVDAVIDAALEMVDYSLKANGVTVVRNKQLDLPSISVDADQLHQVFMNLFVNAYQAMADVNGARTLTITTRRDAAARKVCIDVADTGPGIPEQFRARIFDPYFTTKAVGNGTGVGLSVSLGIVEAHDGTLTVECPPEGGSRFSLTLPITATDQADPEPDCAHLCGAVQRCVLVVDDEPEIRELLADIVRKGGSAVDTAEDGVRALELLAQNARRYDVVLTDLRMPGLDGPGLYREIQKRWPRLALRVAFVSGDSLSSSVPHFVSETGQPMIEKPFNPAAVRRVIQELASADTLAG